MGPVKCCIILEKASKMYYAGEIIQGMVAISFKTATKVSGINLYLLGKATFGIFGQDNFEPFHEKKSVEVNKILPSGTHKFPIIWTLPLDLISSFTWKSGSINYQLLTEIKDCQSTSSSHTNFAIELVQASAPLEIHNGLDLNDLPLEYQRPRGYNSSYFLNSGRAGGIAGTIALDFVVDRQCYVPGQFMKFTCSITYDTPGRLRTFPGVKVILDQQDTYFNEGSVTTSITKIWQKNGPKIRRNDTTIWEDQIKIPTYCQSTPMEFSGIMNIQYFLNVTACFWSTTEKTEFRIPIIIGMIPLNQSHQNVLPMVRRSQRPFVTVLNGDTEHTLEDFEDEEGSDCPLFSERSETPPPTYGEALLLTTGSGFISSPSPPPYYL